MLEILESRNLIINNKEFAINALNNFSYYHIVNGFKSAFLNVPGSDTYISGTKFEDLYMLNIINTDLNNILFKYILYIEKSLKSKLSYRISDKYGVYTDIRDPNTNNKNDYLCYRNYSNSTNRRYNILCKIKKSVTDNSNNVSIKHYIDEKNHLPCWIMINVIPFGVTINWYRILIKEDKDYICSQMIQKSSIELDKQKEFLIKAFELLKDYRNKIAHGSKTNASISCLSIPKSQLISLSYGLLSEEEYASNNMHNDIYIVFLLILILNNDHIVLNNFYIDCYVFFKRYEDEKFNGQSIQKILGLPENILERIYTYLQKFLQT